MQQVVTIQAAMPSAVFSIVLVRLYGRDTVTAIQVILGTSVAGVLLIPLWLVLGRVFSDFRFSVYWHAGCILSQAAN